MATKKAALEASQRKITITFGYFLFAAAIAAMVITTIIPWTTLLVSPNVRQMNVISTMVAFIAAAIVPFLVAYIVGDKATRTKNKVVHHYNGILFGVLAYWLAQLFSTLAYVAHAPLQQIAPDYSLQAVIGWQIIATIVVTAIVAVAFHARPQKTGASVLTYRPFQFTLLASLVVPFALSLTQLHDHYVIGNLINIGVPAVIIAISYIALKKAQPSRRARLIQAIIAFSFGTLALQFAMQIVSNIPYTVVIASAVTVVGAAVWIAYLWLSIHRATRIS